MSRESLESTAGARAHPPESSLGAPIAAAIAAAVIMAVGFLILQRLMRERPQFAGENLVVETLELEQEAPSLVQRKVRDDVAVCEAIQPARSDIEFHLGALSDYRGLRTAISLGGEFRATYTIGNELAEPVFVLFRFPHPRAARGASKPLNVSALSLVSDGPGQSENADGAWSWSGELQAGESRRLTISYRSFGLHALRYAIPTGQRVPIAQQRLAIAFERLPLPPVAFESGDGPAKAEGDGVTWDRRDFLPPEEFTVHLVESRNLFTSLAQLLEIGPVLAALFLTCFLVTVHVRRPLNGFQVITAAATYAMYFPLILYLSVRFQFHWALLIAFGGPAALLLNHARHLVGFRLGVVVTGTFLLLFQVFPTLASFAGWNRGLVLLCLGAVTLFVLIELQNRMLGRAKAIARLATALLLAAAPPARAQDVQVTLPGKIAPDPAPPPPRTLLSYGIASYVVTLGERGVGVEMSVPLEVLRAGADDPLLFQSGVHLVAQKAPPQIRFVMERGLLAVHPLEAGAGTLELGYRAPLVVSGARVSARVPLLASASGQLTLRAPRADLEFDGGVLWRRSTAADETTYELTVTGGESLLFAWAEGEPVAPAAPSPGSAAEAGRLYGIRITESEQLTVIGSDGSATHFARFRLPAFHPPSFALELPAGARVISATVDGLERDEPLMEGRRCMVALDAGAASTPHEVALRIQLADLRLGFIDDATLAAPSAEATIGTLRWTIALPAQFRAQLLASTLDPTSSPAPLAAFGDYGDVAGKATLVALSKSLVPPRPVEAKLRCRQIVPGLTDRRDAAAERR